MTKKLDGAVVCRLRLTYDAILGHLLKWKKRIKKLKKVLKNRNVWLLWKFEFIEIYSGGIEGRGAQEYRGTKKV